VSIVDEAGQLLADGASGEADNAIGDERRSAFEKRMRNQVEAIVSSVVGSGRARVQLSADFDYNKITQTSDRFDPEGRVLRSSQTREESAATADNSGQVTVNNELPGNQGGNNAATARDQSKKSEETNNYEISRTTKTEVTEAGRVNRISVAVLVDGAYSKNEKGEQVYQDRSKEQLDRIAALVRSAIGFDQKRGDQVEVVNLRFAEAPAVPPVAEPTGLLGMLQFTKDDVMYGIELAVMMLLGLVVLFMVIRPLVKRILAAEVIPSLTGAGTMHALTDGSAPGGAEGGTPGQALLPGSNANALIDVAQVQGQVHAQAVHRVGELAERNPNETASIVRQWLTEPAT
jgi:flagellar M-ring protein FliF